VTVGARAVSPELRQRLKPLALDEARRFVCEVGEAVRTRLGDTQWRGLVAAAQEAAVPEEVVALLRYKIGKDDRWRAAQGGPGVGERCLQAVRAVREGAVQVAGAFAGEDATAAELEALALFFGYVAWMSVACAQSRGEAARRGG
jgi:hypothetical protein